jgi:hypothetical protein
LFGQTLDREQTLLLQQANGPRSACCAFSVKHRPMLQRAGYKPAFHLVAHNQMDREHPARLYPQAPPFGASGQWTAQRLLRPLPQAPAHVAAGEQDARAPFGLFQTK